MRQLNFMLLAQQDDTTEAFKLGTAWIIDGGLYSSAPSDGAQTVSIRSLQFPDYYIRIVNGFTVVLQQLKMEDATFLKEATFLVRRGLADPNQISFEHLP